jgi:YidC/Oxa1 family membrane protein insertase
MLTHPFLAENSLFKGIGEIFHPLFELFGLILSGLYAVWPNYGFAIAGLTVIIMLALTPVTVKSTKSMLAMQRLQPEMKKLQAKYKGTENRELLNQEMMRLYKENGTSPFGACLPSLLQMPFLIVLYTLIRGLSATVARGATYVNAAGQSVKCQAATCGAPKYIPVHSQMHTALVQSSGQMHWWFGMDLSSLPLQHHGANQFLLTIPYLVLIAAAMFLQYYQMRQMNSRNPQAAAANPQMQTMQKFFPIIFGVIYLRVPAGATIYMVVSSAMRIGTQEIMFKTGVVTPVAAEREIGSGKPGKGKPEKAGPAKAKPAPRNGNGTAKDDSAKNDSAEDDGPAAPDPRARGKSAATDGTSVAKSTLPPAKRPSSTNGRSNANGRRTSSTRGASGRKSNGSAAGDDAETAKQHPRSRSKRARKAR